MIIPGHNLDIDMRESNMEAVVTRIANCPRPAWTPNPSKLRYSYMNDWYPWGDGIFNNGMLRWMKPKRVIEVGCGWSSSAMLDISDDAGLDIEFTFIDPNVSRLMSKLTENDKKRAEVINKEVQDVPKELFSKLQSNDLLFIDSSHWYEEGSDVFLLLEEILPSLKDGVFIHFHDIFWPLTTQSTGY